MKHTPGPWHYGEHSKEIYANGVSICRVYPGMLTASHAPDPETQRANRLLIQAAPDLLEACQYVVKWHREHDSGEGELFGLDFVITCIGAIAKATD